MTSEETIKMLTAKVECMKRESSGIDQDCDYRNCDECNLCYEQGTVGEQIEALQMAIEALAKDINVPTNCISREAAIDSMTNTLWHYPNECYRNLNEYEFAKGLAELGLKSVPSAQPEIIRCKECKFAHMTYDGDCKYCDVWFPDESEYLDGDYYCASAERRTDE